MDVVVLKNRIRSVVHLLLPSLSSLLTRAGLVGDERAQSAPAAAGRRNRPKAVAVGLKAPKHNTRHPLSHSRRKTRHPLRKETQTDTREGGVNHPRDRPPQLSARQDVDPSTGP